MDYAGLEAPPEVKKLEIGDLKPLRDEPWYGDMKALKDNLEKIQKIEMKLEVFETELDLKRKETDDQSLVAEEKIKKLEQKFMNYETQRNLAKAKRKFFVLNTIVMSKM